MIEVSGLTKRFGATTAVADVSFQVAAGQLLVLLGSSGSGKTTTMKMLNRLIVPTSGTVTINGQDVGQLRPEQLRRRIGYVIQQIGLFPHLTVTENMAVVPRLLGWPTAKTESRIAELGNLVGLPIGQYANALLLSATQLKRYPHELSGGQQQRIGIARALAADPPVILMDEPFGALDPLIRSQLQQEFRQIQQQFNKTVVMVTHDVAEAVQLADQVALMHEGQLVQIGKPHDLLFHPANDFVRQFFDAQRFQLELMVTNTIHINNYMPEAATEIPDNWVTASITDNLYALLAKMEQAKTEWIGYHLVTDETHFYKQQDLIAAFYRMKQQQTTAP